MRSEPISEVWGSQPVRRHYFQYISLVETRWKLFSRQRGSHLCVVAASQAKSGFVLWVDLFNYCRADLHSHLPENYLANFFDTWLFLHSFRSKKLFELLMHDYTPILHDIYSICKACDNLRSFILTFASNRDCCMVFKNKFSRLLKTEY